MRLFRRMLRPDHGGLGARQAAYGEDLREQKQGKKTCVDAASLKKAEKRLRFGLKVSLFGGCNPARASSKSLDIRER